MIEDASEQAMPPAASLPRRLAGAAARAARLEGVPPGERRAYGILFLLFALLPAAVLSVHHMLTQPTGNLWNDSYVYLGAASDFIDHPTHLYDSAHQQVVSTLPLRTFVHPPSGLLPYLPLVPLVRLFGLPVAASVWTVIDITALFAGLVLLGRRLGLGWPLMILTTLVISLSQPVRWEIDAGQINGLVMLLLVLSVLRMPKTDVGLLMGLALAFKPVSAVVLLVPLLRRQPRVFLAALLTIALLNIPFVVLIGLGPTFFYLGTVLPFFGSYALHSANNISLPSVLQTYLGGGAYPPDAQFAAPVPRGVGAVLLLWCTRLAVILLCVRAAVDRRIGVGIAAALALATVPFMSSTIWPHYLVYLLPLALVTLASSRLWLRLLGGLSLLLLAWVGRPDRLWLGIALLWCAAALLLVQHVRQRNAGSSSAFATAEAGARD